MSGDNQLLTIVIIIIIVLVVIWLVSGMGHGDRHHGHHDHRGRRGSGYGTADPVGGVNSESLGPGELKISWDPAENAVKYKVYISKCRHGHRKSPRRHHGRNAAPSTTQKPVRGLKTASHFVTTNERHCPGCSGEGGDCCPTECYSCVSQYDYDAVIETNDTAVIVETCEPCICFIVVPYNALNDAGKCKKVFYAQVECIVDDVKAWVGESGCNGTTVHWECPKCCEKIHIFVNDQLEACVPCCEANSYNIDWLKCGDCAEISIACESACGLGAKNVIGQCSSPPQSRRNTKAAKVTASKNSTLQRQQVVANKHRNIEVQFI